mmetsp:Transcript_4930/g.12515  ORF Transcript_4930/g.12515 Transcript_4930/m.12515 type:complete len:681 (-) Transcript_4930:42-2084(-)
MRWTATRSSSPAASLAATAATTPLLAVQVVVVVVVVSILVVSDTAYGFQSSIVQRLGRNNGQQMKSQVLPALLDRYRASFSSWGRRDDIVLRLSSNPLDKNDHEEEGQNGALDWRDVRAKLVMQYRAEQQPQDDDNDENLNNENGWAYEAGDAIETGSLIVSAPSQDFCVGGLKQQYFYKSCVLIVEHEPNVFTRGLILNRATDSRTVKDEYGNEWKVRYGGPMQGMDSTDTDDVSFFCLHRLSGRGRASNGGSASPSSESKTATNKDDDQDDDVDTRSLLSELSIPINKDIAMTKWDIAQAIVASGEASVDDFVLVAGYCGWNPGQLEDELHRDNWFAVALDADSIFDTIKKQDQSSIPSGTDMWVQIMTKIGKGSMTSYTYKNKANVRFQDSMLQQWVRQRLASTVSELALSLRKNHDKIDGKESADQSSSLDDDITQGPVNIIPPGTLVRATSPILLDDQIYHKSLVLIIENNEEMMTGIVLNRPSSKSVILNGKELPIRYGGSFGVAHKVKPMIWLHCNKEKLQEAKVGEPLLPIKTRSNMFWRCTQQDAETACEIGLAESGDFFVIEGLSVWKRGKKALAPSEERKSSLDDFEECFSEIDNGAIPTVSSLLRTQEPLSKKNAAENLETANAAWMLAGDASWLLSGSKSRYSQEEQELQDLANTALDRWIRTFLLK